jgi:hypothetical protein
MELPTREKVFQGGSEHVDTVGVTGSNPVSRTIFFSSIFRTARRAFVGYLGILVPIVLRG